uniref:Uncharacterized protein n=1 Tax=Buteo japonicus TaxID=224669 RepID=A0A8C0ANE2_9AVES
MSPSVPSPRDPQASHADPRACVPPRCIDIMELSEQLDLLRFQWHTLKLYCAVCAPPPGTPEVGDPGVPSPGDLGVPFLGDLGVPSPGDPGNLSPGDLGVPSPGPPRVPSPGDLGVPSPGDLTVLRRLRPGEQP